MSHHSLNISFQSQHPDSESLVPPRLEEKSAFSAQVEKEPGTGKKGEQGALHGGICDWSRVGSEGTVVRKAWGRMRPSCIWCP